MKQKSTSVSNGKLSIKLSYLIFAILLRDKLRNLKLSTVSSPFNLTIPFFERSILLSEPKLFNPVIVFILFYDKCSSYIFNPSKFSIVSIELPFKYKT